MNPFPTDIEELEGPFEQTPGTAPTAGTSDASDGNGTVSIKLDDAMAGVAGDTIPSNKGESGEKHFVTPKKSASYVTLKATGVSTETFASYYEWGDGGEEVPDKPLKRRVKRDTTGKTEVTIKAKGSGQVVQKMYVWVIWATCTPRRVGTAVFTKFKATPAQQNPPVAAEPAGSQFGAPNRGLTWSFVFKIEPPEIITADDHPLLKGEQDKSHDVPGAKKPYPTEPDNPNRFADEAVFKWDTSRQMKRTVTASTGVPPAVAFPGGDAEGNDDAKGDGVDEANNPYDAYDGSSSLAHGVGEISSVDGPTFGRYITEGSNDGEKYRLEVEFREFARVQLWDGKRSDGDYWFRISDYVAWHHYFRAKFTTHVFGAPTWDNDGSNEDKD